VARKRHSHSSDRQTLLKYSLMGAGVAIGVAILDRVALAAAGIGRVFGQIGAFFARNALVMLGALGVLVLGAGAGAVYYLRKAAAERRLRHNKHSSSHRIRRRRREQRP
jgi:hypothetical protein